MAFATYSDVATRLARTLTTAEQNQATAVIAAVTGLITEEVGKADVANWAATLSPVPETLKSLCVEKAVAVISNPRSVASESVRLGAAERSSTFPRASDIGIFLSDEERLRARRAVGAPTAGTSRPRSVVDVAIALQTDDGLVET